MKKRWKECRGILLLGMAIGWWGLWYPELEKAADTYALVWEDGTVQMSSELLEYEFDETEQYEIHISSKLWKMWKEFWIEDKK